MPGKDLLLPELRVRYLHAHFNHLRFLTALVLTALLSSLVAQAQAPADNTYYSRKNTFGFFGAYSGDSSHMLLGDAENRKLLEFGVSYGRRLVLNHVVNWQYSGELLPLVLESDPMTLFTDHQTQPTEMIYSFESVPEVSCSPVTVHYSYVDQLTGITYSGSTTTSCHGRRWVTGVGMSPAGFQLNFLPRRKVQPFLIGHGGYMYSSQAIPIDNAGSFNFTFDIGAGFEMYRAKARSIRAEYRYHHISNNNTARLNPGIDNGVIQFTYCFGH